MLVFNNQRPTGFSVAIKDVNNLPDGFSAQPLRCEEEINVQSSRFFEAPSIIALEVPYFLDAWYKPGMHRGVQALVSQRVALVEKILHNAELFKAELDAGTAVMTDKYIVVNI